MRSARRLTGVLAIALTATHPIGCAAGESEVHSGSPESSSKPYSSSGPPSLVGWGAFDDALLDLRLRIALLEKIGTAALRVEIHSSSGTVRLDGQVPSSAIATRVCDLSRATRGVVEVVDGLSLADSSPRTADPPDDRQRLRDALLAARTRQALVEVFGHAAFELGVEASNSHLILRGTVADRRSRDRAIAAASEVRGVEQVHDLLRLAG